MLDHVLYEALGLQSASFFVILPFGIAVSVLYLSGWRFLPSLIRGNLEKTWLLQMGNGHRRNVILRPQGIPFHFWTRGYGVAERAGGCRRDTGRLSHTVSAAVSKEPWVVRNRASSLLVMATPKGKGDIFALASWWVLLGKKESGLFVGEQVRGRTLPSVLSLESTGI